MSASSALPFGLAGATLLELTRRDRIQHENDAWTLHDNTPSGHPPLDAALERMAEASEPKGTMHWLRHLDEAGDGLKTMLLQGLVERGILKEEEHRFLWIIPYERYPTEDAAPERRLREQIRRVILEEEEPDERTLALLALMQACNLIGEVFDSEEQNEHRERLDALTKDDHVAAAVSDATEEAVAALIAATSAASAAATTTATS